MLGVFDGTSLPTGVTCHDGAWRSVHALPLGLSRFGWRTNQWRVPGDDCGVLCDVYEGLNLGQRTKEP